jgi:hypothetical protein
VENLDDGGSSGVGDATVSADGGAGILTDGGSPGDADSPTDAPLLADAARDAGAEGCNGRPPLPPGASLPPPLGCGYKDSGANFPLFEKCCAVLNDCRMATYQFRCCGDTYSVGFNKAESDAFERARVGWACAECDCASGGNHTEDGLTADVPMVACDNGYCMTHGQR